MTDSKIDHICLWQKSIPLKPWSSRVRKWGSWQIFEPIFLPVFLFCFRFANFFFGEFLASQFFAIFFFFSKIVNFWVWRVFHAEMKIKISKKSHFCSPIFLPILFFYFGFANFFFANLSLPNLCQFFFFSCQLPHFRIAMIVSILRIVGIVRHVVPR